MSENIINKNKTSEFNDINNVKNVRRIFVTGGSGLVGSHLVTELVKQGRQVKAMYRSKLPDIICKDKVEWIKGDILDVISLNEAMQNVDQVYHCAAIVSFNPGQKNKMFATNAEGTANVVDACLQAGVKKLCFVSSVAALGQTRKGEEINESMTWNEETTNSNYGRSKYLAEMEVWRGIGEGLEAVIVNPAIILGAGNWNEGSTKIFKTAFEEFPWYTEGESGFADVNDVVSIMIQLIESDISAERFIVCNENRKFKEIFTAIAKAFGKKPPYKKVTPIMSDIIWRIEAIKAMFTNENSLLTKETARAAQTTIRYNNTKIKSYLPSFNYTPLDEAINRICKELQHQLICNRQ